MKYKSQKQKKPRKRGDRGSWLQGIGAVLAGIGTFLLGLAEILKVIFRLAD